MIVNINGSFFGYKIVESDSCCNMVQRRKHRKKRINKKWLKRYGIKYIPSKDLIIVGDTIYGHPKVIAKILESLKERAEGE